MLGTVVLPTFTGHFNQAKRLIESIKNNTNNVYIDIIISKDDKELFTVFERDEQCRIKYIEDLIKDYCSIDITSKELLGSVGKFRFQAIKKILGVLYSNTEISLILDSESNIVKNIDDIFLSGVEGASIVFSNRKWEKIPPSLTTEVRSEVNYLLGQENSIWFFESFNWVYEKSILKEMLEKIEGKLTDKWIFRNVALFECQLYYQYAYYSQRKYNFINVENLLSKHFTEQYSKKIIDRFWNSNFTACGIIEYIGNILTREEYKGFISNPEVIKHLRLVRHEPSTIYDVVSEVRGCSPHEYYYGEAAMHRGDFTRGKIAILLSGNFQNQEEILNVKNFLLGVECDIFVTTSNDNPLYNQIKDLLNPVLIEELDDSRLLGKRSVNFCLTKSAKEKFIKHGRDIGSTGMFDKISSSYNNMLDNESKTNVNYEIIVRMRPDCLSISRLKDVFLQVAEYSQVDDETIFFPNRFWSQGVNDQFFFGNSQAMKKLLSSISGERYTDSDYLNAEYFLGQTLLKRGLKPVPFDFQYILTRGNFPNIQDVTFRYQEQEHLFWSRTINSPCWKSAELHLKVSLDNVFLKNTKIETQLATTTKNIEVEFFTGKDKKGQVYICTSEYKSPLIYMSPVNRLLVPFLTYLIILGFPFSITDKSNVRLLGYKKCHNKNIVTVKELNEDVKPMDLEVFFLKNSPLSWFVVQVAKFLKRILFKVVGK